MVIKKKKSGNLTFCENHCREVVHTLAEKYYDCKHLDKNKLINIQNGSVATEIYFMISRMVLHRFTFDFLKTVDNCPLCAITQLIPYLVDELSNRDRGLKITDEWRDCNNPKSTK